MIADTITPRLCCLNSPVLFHVVVVIIIHANKVSLFFSRASPLTIGDVTTTAPLRLPSEP